MTSLPRPVAPPTAGIIRDGHIPSMWTRVAAIAMDRTRIGVVWIAISRVDDIAHLYSEYVAPLGALPVHADAIRGRGAWIPVLVDAHAFGRSKEEATALLIRLANLNLSLFEGVQDDEAGISDIVGRYQQGRLKVFGSCREWLRERQTYRRGLDGKLPAEGFHLIRATGLALGPGVGIAVSERKAISDEEGYDPSDSTRNSVTGY